MNIKQPIKARHVHFCAHTLFFASRRNCGLIPVGGHARRQDSEENLELLSPALGGCFHSLIPDRTRRTTSRTFLELCLLEHLEL